MGIFERLFSNDHDRLKSIVDQLSDEVAHRVETKLTDEFVALAEVEQATEKVVKLTGEIAQLKEQKASIEEGFARREREGEHKIGLLRQEIEAEKAQSEKDFALRVKEAKLEAREEGLQQRQQAFTERMDFMTKRFEGEVGYLKELLEAMSARLPDASIIAVGGVKPPYDATVAR
jgi:hypothetical protein